MKNKIAAFLIAFSISGGLGAQERRDLQDIDFVKDINPWLTFSNSAGLTTLQTERSDTACLEYEKTNGALKGISDSDDSHDVSISTEALIKVSKRMSLYGLLSYDYFYGKNMGGSVFWTPSYNPFDLIEFSETTVGTKIKERYKLIGALSYDIADNWAIGLSIDYTTGNYSKRKDPRYKNTMMDLEFSAGVRWSPSESFSIGLNALYLRKIESISGKLFGYSAENYYTFVDYGGFWGNKEIFSTDNGYMPAESSTRPMLNNIYGGAIQVSTGRNIRTYHELKYLRRNGFYGKRASTEVVFCEFAGNAIIYDGSLVLSKGKTYHKINIGANYQGLKNQENIYRKSTKPGENTVTEYLGKKEVLDRTDVAAKIEYKGWTNVRHNRPEWEFGASILMNYRTFTTTIYPFYRMGNLCSFTADIFLGKDFTIKEKNIISVRFDLTALYGFGNPRDDGQLASASSGKPLSADNYLEKDFEFRTAPRAGGLLAARYTRLMNTRYSIWFEISDTYSHALQKLDYLTGNNKNILSARIGFSF